jgi:cadmium resistance protein CadD (predicted permease)
MNGWAIAKGALVLVGVSLLLLGDSLGRHWIGYVGLVPIVAAFLLRFVQRRFDSQREDPATPSADL